MKALFSIISPVLPVSIVIFALSCLAAGSVGPCGPNGRYAALYFIGYPIGFIGILVGLFLSGLRGVRYYSKLQETQKYDDDIRL
jgi:hypothetical protein